MQNKNKKLKKQKIDRLFFSFCTLGKQERALAPNLPVSLSLSLSPRSANAILLSNLFNAPLLVEHAEQLVVPVQQQLLALVLQGGAAVLGQQDGVSLLDRDRDDLARERGAAARAHGDDLALGQLSLFGGGGEGRGVEGRSWGRGVEGR
jgi:hypothetical protein